MRDRLAPLNGNKSLFYATFKRYGWRKFRGQYVGKTLLFVDIQDKDGRQLSDHLWFKSCMSWERLALKSGDKVAFHARVDTYTRRGDDYDYHLEYPERLVKVNDEEQAKL